MIDEPGCTGGSWISREAGARAAAQQPKVRRDLADFDREPAQRAE